MINTTQLKPVVFIKEVKSELKKVTWPTKQEAARLTAIVIAVSVLVGLVIGFFDYLFTKLMEIILRR